MLNREREEILLKTHRIGVLTTLSDTKGMKITKQVYKNKLISKLKRKSNSGRILWCWD